MTVLSIQRVRNGVLTSADQGTLSILNSAGAIVLPTTIIAPTSAGVYSYETTALAVGSYTATWTFTTAGLPTDTIQRAFTVDAAVELAEGVTLMDLERAIARRVGPYRKLAVGVGSTPNLIVVPRLRSSLDLGTYEEQYIRRRFLTTGDELITGSTTSDDDVRLVSAYNAIDGTLAVDRAYTNAPISGEAIELHALDPLEELRPAAIDGLKRCFFWDTVEITVTGSGIYNINLSASMPWLAAPQNIANVSLSFPSQLLPPTRLQWWEPYRSGKDIRLWTKGGAVGSVSVLALRPAHTLVNGELSLGGPNDSLDAVYIDLDYAAWAGVLECWKNYPEVLTPLAAQAMRPSREDAANEFTKMSLSIVQQVPEYAKIDYGVPDLVQIGNLAEPVT